MAKKQPKGENWERIGTIAKIVDRAEKLNIRKGTRITAILDVDLADKKWNLRLEDWLNADDFNFVHDFIGIQNHIDRLTKTFSDRFLPRFAKQEV